MRGREYGIEVMGAAILTPREVETIARTLRERRVADGDGGPSEILRGPLDDRAVRLELVIEDDPFDEPFRVETRVAAMAEDLSASLHLNVYAHMRDWDTGGQAVTAFEDGRFVGELVHGGEEWPGVEEPRVWPLERLAAAVKDPALERAFLDDLALAEQEKREEDARAEQEERDHPLPYVPARPRALPPADPAAIDAIFGGLFGAVLFAGLGGYVGFHVIGRDLGILVGAALAVLPGGVLGARVVRTVARARAMIEQR